MWSVGMVARNLLSVAWVWDYGYCTVHIWRVSLPLNVGYLYYVSGNEKGIFGAERATKINASQH
jgi:hypothetical protein